MAGDACPHRGVGRDGGGTGGIGENAEVNVPQGSQLGLEEHVPPIGNGLVEVQRGVADIVRPGQAELPQPGQHVRSLDGLVSVAALHRQVLPLHDIRQMLGMVLQIQQIAHAEGLFHIFVRIDGGDAPAGGAKLLPRQPVLLQAIQQLVIGHADGGLVADFEALRRDLNAAVPKTLYLAAQVLQVDDHARAQHVHRARAEDAGGHEVEDEPAPVVDHGMAGVVAACPHRPS